MQLWRDEVPASTAGPVTQLLGVACVLRPCKEPAIYASTHLPRTGPGFPPTLLARANWRQHALTQTGAPTCLQRIAADCLMFQRGTP